MRFVPSALAPLIPLLFASGCAQFHDTRASVVEVLAERHRSDTRLFELARRRVADGSAMAAVLDRGGEGRLQIRDATLLGWPKAAYVQVEYTFVNTSTKTRKPPRVTLEVRDPETGDGYRVTEELPAPLGLYLRPGSSYSSWIEVPTKGLHRRAGWVWDLFVEGI